MLTKKQIWITIIGSAITAGITTAAGFFPEQRVILIPAAGLVTAVVAYLTGQTEE